MVEGEPRNAKMVGAALEAGIDDFAVVDEVVVADHDALGGAGGAGGVLKEGEGAVGGGGLGIWGFGREVVGGEGEDGG